MELQLHLRYLLLGIFIPVSVSCTNPPTKPPPPEPTLESVSVTPGVHLFGEFGEDLALSAVGKDNTGKVMSPLSFTWTSSNPAVVAVDQAGTATAIGNGESTVTATSGGVSGRSVLTVDDDFDDDGILNIVDACPQEPETFNNLSDSDGCADDSLDFYRDVRLDIESYWSQVFTNSGLAYAPISGFTSYTIPVSTACGELGLFNAFYCSADEGVYYDRAFLDFFLTEVGDAAPAFVFAHEIGHHVSNLLGWLAENKSGNVSDKQIELQADCWAGAWLRYVDSEGRLETGDENEAVLTLFSIGDPSLEWFNPEGHGSPGQRIDAFKLGFDQGPSLCDDPGNFPWASVFPPLPTVANPLLEVTPAGAESLNP